MNKKDKHNLPPENLFNLLGSKHPETDGLDDFEKEALEGYALLDDKQQAIDAYQRTLANLSKKNDTLQQARRKKRVIWFSAAAAVLVLFGLIFTWFISHQDAAITDLAMNNSQPAPVINNEASDQPLHSMTDSVAPPVQEMPVTGTVPGLSDNEGAKGSDTKSLVKEEAPVTTAAAPALSETDLAQVAGNAHEAEEKPQVVKPEEKSKEQTADETVASGKKDADKSYQPAAGDGQQLALEKNNKKTKASYQASYSRSVSQQPVNATSGLYAPEPKKEAEQKNANMRPEVADADYKEIILSDSTMGWYRTPGKDSQAYIEGGESTLRAHVHKKVKHIALTGAYVVKAHIAANGTLHVISVANPANNCPACVAPIKAALEKMKGWQPAMQNGRASGSDVIFTLTF